MKVFGLPEGLDAPEFDYKDYNGYLARCEEHTRQLRLWLQNNRYTGKHSGKIVSFSVADGYARYMFAEAGRGSGVKSILLHLPYSDAWVYRDVEFLPKKEIIARIERQENMDKLFSGQGSP